MIKIRLLALYNIVESVYKYDLSVAYLSQRLAVWPNSLEIIHVFTLKFYMLLTFNIEFPLMKIKYVTLAILPLVHIK